MYILFEAIELNKLIERTLCFVDIKNPMHW